jgi:hypothetical protein
MLALLVIIIGGTLGSVSAILVVDEERARRFSREEVGPLAKRLDAHLARSETLIPEMERFAQENKTIWLAVAANQYRICQRLRIECELPGLGPPTPHNKPVVVP